MRVGRWISAASLAALVSANFGVAPMMKISAPEPCSVTTWESTVGSEVSYEASLTIMPA